MSTVIRVENLSKYYRLGPNGAGKSTLRTGLPRVAVPISMLSQHLDGTNPFRCPEGPTDV